MPVIGTRAGTGTRAGGDSQDAAQVAVLDVHEAEATTKAQARAEAQSAAQAQAKNASAPPKPATRAGAPTRSACIGVSYSKKLGKFRARTGINKAQFYLGAFDTAEQAAVAVREWRETNGIL